MENEKYVYLGKNVNLQEFRFDTGGVYFGEKIKELKERYPLLDKLLIKIEDLPNYKKNDVFLEKISEELLKNIEGGIV